MVKTKNRSSQIHTSQILANLSKRADSVSHISLGELLESFESRVYGISLLVFSLPSVLPSSSIPGVAAFFGIVILILTLQLIVARPLPWLPLWLKKKTLKAAHLQKFIDSALPYVKRTERFIKPRYPLLSKPYIKCLTGVIIAILSILLMLPIPFSNMLFGGLIALLALGLIERDGLVLLGGLVTSFIVIILYLQAFRYIWNIFF